MITTNSIVHGNCLYQLNFNHEEHPVGVQFGGNNPKDLVYCSQIAEEYGYDENDYPYYFNKFFIYGDKELEFSNSFEIYNKVGSAYGQLTDTAYIIYDDISIILTATIDVNSNKIYNDDNYDYDLVGFPFLAQLSRGIFQMISNN